MLRSVAAVTVAAIAVMAMVAVAMVAVVATPMPAIVVAPPTVLMAAVAAYHVVVAQVRPIDVERDVHAADPHVTLQCDRQADAGLPTGAAQPEPHPRSRFVVHLGRRVVDILKLGAPAVRRRPRRRIGQRRGGGEKTRAGERERDHGGDAGGFHVGFLL